MTRTSSSSIVTGNGMPDRIGGARRCRWWSGPVSAALFAASLSGCFHTAAKDPYVIVERSKAERPTWVAQVGVLENDQQYFHYAFQRSEIVNLPLGISQSQLAAKQISEERFAKSIEADLVSFAEEASITLINRSELLTMVAASVGEVFANEVRISDIYYEKVRDPQSSSNGKPHETYRVFVNVRWPHAIRQSALERFISLAKAAKVDDLRQLASLIPTS